MELVIQVYDCFCSVRTLNVSCLLHLTDLLNKERAFQNRHDLIHMIYYTQISLNLLVREERAFQNRYDLMYMIYHLQVSV
jgi:hypothetical protein